MYTDVFLASKKVPYSVHTRRNYGIIATRKPIIAAMFSGHLSDDRANFAAIFRDLAAIFLFEAGPRAAQPKNPIGLDLQKSKKSNAFYRQIVTDWIWIALAQHGLAYKHRTDMDVKRSIVCPQLDINYPQSQGHHRQNTKRIYRALVHIKETNFLV